MAVPAERRRLIVLAAIGGGLLVVLVLLRFVVMREEGGGAPSGSSTSTTATAGPGSSTTSTSEPFDDGVRDVPPQLADPFVPKVLPTSPTTSPFPTTPTTSPFPTTPTTSPYPTFPTTPTTSPFPTTPTTGPPNPPGQQPVPPNAVTLIDIFDSGGRPVARIQVGSTIYEAGVGETFAGSYRVLGLDGRCGDFLFGDSPFGLCEGEQVLK